MAQLAHDVDTHQREHHEDGRPCAHHAVIVDGEVVAFINADDPIRVRDNETGQIEDLTMGEYMQRIYSGTIKAVKELADG